ncbi:hypothetical protein SERLA73DRAFT_123032 [Serpula lacrymans var. lacrymans S7.3]|uniref:Uncharacterized protein n=2 Tax=Serpula lacrymans var. lacrymans TaxID=341189 RepID=F8PZA7_SERL3|nr:uncharacterized protein SERLADRAFT_370031 [Serpula lacrymans var. lacrymans S7.9]EGN99220.1 hypothetical protein SERLA73DRAFT_123032 [Serpula lacrymans var. lacrymans S7.3]EGO24787.1 hypothetical protein SERLADRAFT_370031 [Serpula lacrymans var. lacrymans S7.9]
MDMMSSSALDFLFSPMGSWGSVETELKVGKDGVEGNVGKQGRDVHLMLRAERSLLT